MTDNIVSVIVDRNDDQFWYTAPAGTTVNVQFVNKADIQKKPKEKKIVLPEYLRTIKLTLGEISILDDIVSIGRDVYGSKHDCYTTAELTDVAYSRYLRCLCLLDIVLPTAINNRYYTETMPDIALHTVYHDRHSTLTFENVSKRDNMYRVLHIAEQCKQYSELRGYDALPTDITGCLRRAVEMILDTIHIVTTKSTSHLYDLLTDIFPSHRTLLDVIYTTYTNVYHPDFPTIWSISANIRCMVRKVITEYRLHGDVPKEVMESYVPGVYAHIAHIVRMTLIVLKQLEQKYPSSAIITHIR